MNLIDEKTYFELAKAFDLVPVVRRVPADTETPVSTYLKIARGPWSFLLESVEGGARWGRYSIVGFDPFLMVEHGKGGTRAVGDIEFEKSSDPIELLRAVAKRNTVARFGDLPRFVGGLVGYFGYGTAKLFEKLPELPPDESGLPDIRLFSPRKLLAFDNVRQTLDIIVITRPGDEPAAAYAKAQAEIDAIHRRLRCGLWETDAFPPKVSPVELKPLMEKERFKDMVVKAKEAIVSGEAIQIVVSQAFEGEAKLDPFTAYRALRMLNPSPYMFFLAMGEEVLVGASPEVMVRVEDGRALVRPIAGTRPRGATPDIDEALSKELLSDEKERAEHVMLVDLGRNDLGRIAAKGSVRLDESFVVERYSHVMHLVSTVSAQVREGLDALDVLSATFPAGTVSGAPKVRAMEIISELEGRERGFYAGAVGYVGFDGNMDTCIAIRTMLFNRGKVTLQAGAGIVADSDPEFEYNETVHKATALMRALQIAADGLE